MQTLSDTKILFEAFQAGTSAADQGCRVEAVTLASAHQDLLTGEDRDAVENQRFRVPLLLPDREGPFDRLCVLFHGLNEGTEAKLFPWAANLAARGMPAIVFPSSFHLSRRPQRWLETRGEAFAARRAVEGNQRSSPYNAILSARMASGPDRFLRGTMQTYRDVVDVARGLREGTHETLSRYFSPGARMHFLAYSIGGYLAKLALLRDPDGLFSDSRAVLFSTGAALYHVAPQTILILDVDAKQRLYAHYDTEEGRAGRHPLLDELRTDDEERRWLTSMLYAGPALQGGLQGLGKRILGIANRADQVFPFERVSVNFAGLPFEALDLGLHELPFNQMGPLGETYSDREGRKLLISVVRSYAVAPELHQPFARFVEMSADHLLPPGGRA